MDAVSGSRTKLELCSPMSDDEHRGGGRQGCCEHVEQGDSKGKQGMVSNMHMCSVVC